MQNGEGGGAEGGQVREHLFKVLVIGDLGTGKTSYIKRYVHQTFTPHYRATIGVDFALKVLTLDKKDESGYESKDMVRLQLWDIAGQERFGQMTRVYYKEATGCLIVYDVTRRATFDSAIKWKEDLDSKVRLKNGNKIPCVLIGSKSDQLDTAGSGCNDSNMEKFCQQHGFCGWYEVSSMTNQNIDQSANFLVERILEVSEAMNSPRNHTDPEIVNPSHSTRSDIRSKCCS